MKSANVTAPTFKAKDQEQAKVAIGFLQGLREKAVKEQIRATAAIKLLHDKHPELKRAVVYKSAVYAGINMDTARNVWDGLNNG